MSTKPTSVARWADVGGAITVPPSGKQDIGWVSGEAPPAQYFNWIENLAYQWQKWLLDGNCTFAALAASTFSVTGATTLGVTGFTGLLTASAGITVPTGQALTLAGTATLTVGTGLAAFGGAVTVGGTLGVTGLLTASAGITVPTGQALTLAGTATLTVGGTSLHTGTATFSGSAIHNGDLVANGNVTLGDAAGDALAVNATSTFAALVTANSGITAGANQHFTVSGTGDYKHGDVTRTMSAFAFVSSNPSSSSYVANGIITSSAAVGWFAAIPLKKGDRLKSATVGLIGNNSVQCTLQLLTATGATAAASNISTLVSVVPVSSTPADFTATVTSPVALGARDSIWLTLNPNGTGCSACQISYTFDHP